MQLPRISLNLRFFAHFIWAEFLLIWEHLKMHFTPCQQMLHLEKPIAERQALFS